MTNKKLLIELIELLSQFESETSEVDEVTMTGFVGFLNSKVVVDQPQNDISNREQGGNAIPWLTEMGEETNSTIARLVTIMNRYARFYIKKALEGTDLNTTEEFSFLILLLTFQDLTKSELIQRNIMEKTSGIEVIKRLQKLGLVDEADDPNDKRSKRISISGSGKKLMFEILPKMHKVTDLVAGNLTKNERLTLAYLLKKLDHYHYDVYTNNKQLNINELLKKYQNSLDDA